MNAPDRLLPVPPHNAEAEQWVLGCLLLDNGAFDTVAAIVAAEDFYRDDHRRIFTTISRLIADGKPADVVTVDDALRAANISEQTGGLAYLGEMANAVPSSAPAARYAQIVADRALRRRLMAVGMEISLLAQSPGAADTRALVDEAQGRVMALAESAVASGEPALMASFAVEVIEEIEALFNGARPTGTPSGFRDLDALTMGLKPGQVIVVAGRPSMGKTAFALNVAEHVATREGGTVAVFSMEMQGAELVKRSVASLGRIDMGRLMRGSLAGDDWDKMTVALDQIHAANLVIDESGGLTLAQLRGKARRIKRQHGGLDLIVIDYLQLMAGSGLENRNADLTDISRGIKAMAKELRCPVIALSQLSRKVEDRSDRRPMLSDLRESGAIEQDADVVVMMFREDYYKPDTPNKGIAEAIVAKHRNGPTGKVLLAFHGEFCRFDNLSDEFARRYAEGNKPKAAKAKGFDDGAPV